MYLDRIDSVKRRFLRNLGVTEKDAFLYFNLAPLNLRRTIAMLGGIHRAVYGNAHPSLCSLFERAPQVQEPRTRANHAAAAHGLQLVDYCHVPGHCPALLQRSVYGLVAVWNALPPNVVQTRCLHSFQGLLQDIAKARCSSGREDWALCFTHPRW